MSGLGYGFAHDRAAYLFERAAARRLMAVVETFDAFEQGAGAREAALHAARDGLHGGLDLDGILAAVRDAHAEALELERARRGVAEAVLSVALVLLDADSAQLGAVGDVCVYQLRGERCSQVGAPHVYPPKEGQRPGVQPRLLTRALRDRSSSWDKHTLSLAPGDRLALVSGRLVQAAGPELPRILGRGTAADAIAALRTLPLVGPADAAALVCELSASSQGQS